MHAFRHLLFTQHANNRWGFLNTLQGEVPKSRPSNRPRPFHFSNDYFTDRALLLANVFHLHRLKHAHGFQLYSLLLAGAGRPFLPTSVVYSWDAVYEDNE